MNTSSVSSNIAASHPLAPEQIEHLHREGFLMLPDIFTSQDLQPVIDEIDGEVNRLARQFIADGKLSQTYEEFGFERQLAKINTEAPSLASAMWNSAVVLPSFFHLMRTPRLLDAVESLVGPEIIASSVYRLRPKVPSHHQSAVPWHQDSGYFEPYCDKSLVLTVWLPLVDANESNGCMWVLPRGHLAGGVVRHTETKGKPYLEILPADLPPGQPLCVPVPKGGALLMTNLLPHASFDNNTDAVRWSMDLRYQSTALPTNAPISRLPDETLADESNGIPLACYPPEADFLIHSDQRPREVLQTPEEFIELRRRHIKRPLTSRWSDA
jgi:phytanoyl-CoA hydroxylase